MTLPASYLTETGIFLPGKPVSNSEMEEIIGRIGGRKSSIGKRILRWNGIKQRHYALSGDGRSEFSNAELAARAVRATLDEASSVRPVDIDFLATATTQGDLLVPGHASAVHGALDLGPMEIANFQSVCASSVSAIKAADLRVRAGEKRACVVCGSEFSSRWFRPEFYEGTTLVDAKGRVKPAAEILRWTLSDGAGAVIVSDQPKAHGISLRIDWIDLISYANRFDPCMWAGAGAADRHDLSQSWSFQGPRRAWERGYFALQQDQALLKTIIRSWVSRYLELVESETIDPAAVDHVLVHYSAETLRTEVVRLLRMTNAMIDENKWFSNLSDRGNMGAASIFVLFHDFIRRRAVQEGDRVLCMVPESGRAIAGFMGLTVVKGG